MLEIWILLPKEFLTTTLASDELVVCVTSNLPLSKVKFASPTKLVPLPPVMTLLSALVDIDALDPAVPCAPVDPPEPVAP